MKKITWIYAGVAIMFSFFLISCGPTAHIEKDESVDFGKYKTYAWVEKKNNNGARKERTNDLLENAVKANVNEQLQKMTGWKETSGRPDLLLTYDVMVERSQQKQSDAVYSNSYTRTFYNPRSRRFFSVYYPSQFVGYDNYSVPIEEGTVTVSMIDSKTDKTVWQGWTTDEIDSRRIKSSEVESAVKTIFKKFDLAQK